MVSTRNNIWKEPNKKELFIKIQTSTFPRLCENKKMQVLTIKSRRMYTKNYNKVVSQASRRLLNVMKNGAQKDWALHPVFLLFARFFCTRFLAAFTRESDIHRNSKLHGVQTNQQTMLKHYHDAWTACTCQVQRNQIRENREGGGEQFFKKRY